MNILISISLFLILVVFFILFYNLWLNPYRTRKMLSSQGLNGPSYKFIHGNTKEIMKMMKQSISNPLELSQHDLFPRILPHVDTWMKLYGNNFLIWMGHQPQIVVTEPELVKHIITYKDDAFRKIKPRPHVKKLIGDSLLVTEGEKWFKLRKLANRSFHGDFLKDMVPAMVASVETMLERWQHFAGKEIEVSHEFRLLTSEVISRTAFGSSYQEGKNIFEMITKLAAVVSRNTFNISFLGNILRSKDDVESTKIEKSLRDSIISVIRKREDNVMLGQSNDFGNDYLGSLLKVHHDTDIKNRISISDIIDECKVFYVAGHETTSSLLSWTILLLSIYTDWQEKLREEVLQLIGHQANLTSESIARLKILTMVVNEALRLYSPVTLLTRKTNREVKLGRYKIPANVEVNIPILALHRDPELWGQDAHLFNPERFSGGLAKASNGNPAAFLPFGFGPRICVGLNFAANEVKIALSMILQRHKFTISPNYVHSPFQILTINPQHGIHIVLHSL